MKLAVAMILLTFLAFVQAGHAQRVEATASPLEKPSLLWWKVGAAPIKVMPSPLKGISQQALENQRQRQARLRERQASAERQRQLLEYERNFIPQDPWRALNGKTNFAKGPGWMEFRGEVIEVRPGGIRVVGDFGAPFTPRDSAAREFFVTHFPYPVAAGDYVGLQHQDVAFYAGVYTNTTAAEGARTIPKLDYGVPCGLSEAMEAEKAAERNALRWNESQAAKGDPYGLLRMGERYRDGEGVPKDPAKALLYFYKAMAAGAPFVAEDLSMLNQSTKTPAGR